MESLDIEYLQKLAYDRSKTWSSFFERFEMDQRMERLDDMNDFDLHKLEQVFSPADDDDSTDDLSSMEDDNYDDNVNSEFLKNASNNTQLSLLFGNTKVDLSAITKNEEEQQYLDVINKTLPVLNEHNRQLQELGFDKVLISFKKNEIENKFGSWLNRHNSLFGCDNTLMYDGKNKILDTGKEVETYIKPIMGKSCLIKNKEVDSDSDASLQSGETARYIRSSRVGIPKNPTTTMIKTYRMVRRTREALREKYACETDEDDYNQNVLRVRKKLGNFDYQNHYDMTPFTRARKNEKGGFSSKTQRRKVLRKRININCSYTSYSSSDSESYEYYRKSQRKNLKFCCNSRNHNAANFYKTPLTIANRNILKPSSGMKMSSALKNRLYYFSRSMSYSSSSSSTFYNDSVIKKRRGIKRKTNICNDELAYKRESECHCFNDKELCKVYKHLADTSTEQWHVDSGSTPEKQMKKNQKTTKKSKQSNSHKSAQLQPHTEKILNNVENEPKNLKENNYKSKNEQQQDSFAITSSDSELQMAIKSSKESYAKEQEERRKKSIAKKDDKIMSTQPRNNREQVEGRKKSIAKKDDKIKSTEPRNEKLSKNEAENVSEKAAVKTKIIPKKTDRVTKKSNVVTKDVINQGTKSNEETFFAPTENKAICNSTALSSTGQAYKRQLADKQEITVVPDEDDTATSTDDTVINLHQCSPKAKSTGEQFISTRISKSSGYKDNGTTSNTVASSTLHSPKQYLPLTLSQTDESKQAERPDEKICDDANDCAHVSSTTHIEISTPQSNRMLNTNEECTRNCILIYDPQNQTTISADSFTPDGYFTITQKHLSAVIGEQAAKKFLKYYVGRKRFRLDSMVYYKPPSGAPLRQNLSSSSESTDDLEFVGQYGDIFAVTK